MASRGRVALIAVGVGAAVLVMFVATVWLLIAVTDDGLPGGAKVAVVEVEGVIGTEASRGLDTEDIVRTLCEYRDDPAVRAVVLRINSPGGVVAPTQEIVTAVAPRCGRPRSRWWPRSARWPPPAATTWRWPPTASTRAPAPSPARSAWSCSSPTSRACSRRSASSTWWSRPAPTRTWATSRGAMTPEERRILQSLLDDVYDQFIGAVAEGRGPRPADGARLRRGADLLRPPGPGPQDGRRPRRARGRHRGGGQDGGPARQAQGDLPAPPLLAARSASATSWAWRPASRAPALARDPPDPALPDAVTGRGRGCRLTTQLA